MIPSGRDAPGPATPSSASDGGGPGTSTGLDAHGAAATQLEALRDGRFRPSIAVFVPMPCADTVARLPSWPEDGEKIASLETLDVDGGVSGNYAVAAARLGARVHAFGWTGRDPASAAMRAAFAAETIDCAHLQRRAGSPVFRTFVLVGPDGGRRIVLMPPPLAPPRPHRSWPRALVDVRPALAYAGAWDEHASRFADLATAAAIPVAATIESGSPPPDLRALARLAIVFLSEEVAVTAGWDPGHPDRMPDPWAAGPRCIAVTQGAAGSRCWDRDGAWTAPAPSVSAVDATGAGDAFAAAFSVLWLAGVRGEALPRGANAAGAIAVTGRGPRGALATSRDVAEAIDAGARG